ncbi:MAG: hypothetical protein WBX22_13085 [Silvibacterium sp.]
MNQKTPGELAFEEYLNAQSMAFEHEPPLSFTNKLVDYVVDHPTHGRIYFEVKDIEHSPLEAVGSFAQFDPYGPVRAHIEAGKDKFKDFSDQLCALVLFSQVINLREPNVMLGAMYGNLGFTIPVDTETGVADASQIESKFLVGEGKMVRQTRYQNTRIAALISLVSYNTFQKELALYMRTDDGRSREDRLEDVRLGRVVMSKEPPTLCCTVWENGTAKRRLPQDLFRGPMDAWWTCDEDHQPSFIGERRLALGIDKQR